jgi:hypothetical protein
MNGMDFCWALQQLRHGNRVTRDGWNGKGIWVALQTPDEHSKMRRPYLYLSPMDGELVPWAPGQSDLFASDWRLW